MLTPQQFNPKANLLFFYLSLGLKMAYSQASTCHHLTSKMICKSLALLYVDKCFWIFFSFPRSPTGRKISTDVQVKTKTRKTKISHNLQAGGLLDIVPAPRRRSWRTEEAKGGKSKEDEVVESKLKSHLYVNLPERSSSYDYGRGRLQSKGFEGHVPICQETTPLWQCF